MPLSDLPYTLFIWPVRVLIEFIFILFSRIFYNPALAVILLSLIVNVLLLPIYTVADRWQKEERDLQKRMKQKLADIRAVFSGDERQMLINTYYRQMGYSPLGALKSSAGFLLQIPFFIAAYQFLSHTPSLSGESFGIIANLARPDGLLSLGGRRINLLPVVMTAVNIASSLVYTRGAGVREKLQLFGMALLFLVLLYGSPSALTLYWTMNNVFSLGKNLAAAKLKNPGRALHIASSLAALLLIFSVLSGIADVDRYRGLFAAGGLCLLAAPFVWKALIRLARKRPLEAGGEKRVYFSCAALMLLVLGFLIPSQVLAASVSDFSGPWDFIFRSAVQGFAFCGLLPLLVWAFAGKEIRRILAVLGAVFSCLALISFFALSASYGAITRSFKIEDTRLIIQAFPLWVNLAALGAALAIPLFFMFTGKEKLFAALCNAVSAAVLVMTAVNLVTLGAGVRELAALEKGEGRGQAQEVFRLSSTGRNNFVMFLDRALGIALYTALEEMPELYEGFDGFTFYPNTLSFGNATIGGLPALLGGYEYTPLELNRRKDELLKDKVNEGMTMLPRLFGEAGFRVSITDPGMANLQLVPDISIFAGMENVTAQNLDGRMEYRFMEEFPSTEERFIDSFDFDILFRYGIFRIAPPALRYGIQYKGSWWRDGASNAYGRGLTEFSTLYYLPEFCSADAGGPDTLNIFMNETTHEPGAYTEALRPVAGPIRYREDEIRRFGSEDNTIYMYTFMSAMKAAVRWLGALQDLGVYDNTRIVIVSDHGTGFDNGLFEDNMASFNPLFMVKERNERGRLKISEAFRTNADLPALLARDLDHPLNPYSQRPLGFAADAGPLSVGSEVSFQPRRHGPYLYNLSRIREFTGTDIFQASSWGPWRSAAPGGTEP